MREDDVGTEGIDTKVLRTTGHFPVLVGRGKGESEGKARVVQHSVR